MTESNAEGAFEQPVFAAELTPYRSLGPVGFRILLGLAGVACCLHIGFFTVTGAWPVALFFGADFVLLYGAFWLNYRAARAREEVTVTRDQLAIRKYSPSGKMIEHRFNPFWARFRVRRREAIGIVSMYVTGEGRLTDVGSFLNPDDRESFAAAFTRALATVKQRI